MYKYYEIADAIEAKIQQHHLKAGDRIDSVRKLCADFKCHQSTATKALNHLKEKGILYAIPQSGYYLAAYEPNEKQKSNRIDFSSSSPDPHLFPYKDYQNCVNQAIEKNRAQLFEYSDMEGYKPLKKAIVKLLTNDYIFTNSKNIVVTTGIQQALSILSEMPFSNGGHKILIEQPSYHRYIEYLKLKGMRVECIDRHDEGIDLKAIEAAFASGDIKFFYCMVRVHNPLGTSLCRKEKKALVELAYQYNVYVIEDDYMADYITDKSNDPLISYDHEKSHVIYLRSFSKIIFPGLRVGFAILPSALVNEVKALKFYRDMGTSLLAQASLEIYLKNKMYERHVEKIRKLYEERASIMKDVLTSYSVVGSYQYQASPAIVHTCIDMKKRVSAKTLKDADISIADSKQYYYKPRHKDLNRLLINVSNADPSTIKRGLDPLMKLIGY